jgi:uncharacterized protein
MGSKTVTLDSSAIFALLNSKDPDYVRVRKALSKHRPPFIVATAALAEISYMIETRLGFHVLDAFLNDIEQGLFRLDFLESDLSRARGLARRYQNLPLGLTDALIIVCAERNGGNVISLDEHFWIVSNEGFVTVETL